MYRDLLADLEGAFGLRGFVPRDFPTFIAFLDDNGFVGEFEDRTGNLIRFRRRGNHTRTQQ